MADRMLVKSSSSGVLWETHFFFMPMILSKEQSHLLQKVSYACRRVEETRSSGNVSTGLVWVLPGILFILGWFSSDCRDVTVFHILVMELLEYPGNVPLIKSLPQLPFLLLEIKIDLFQHHHSCHGANQESLPCPDASWAPLPRLGDRFLRIRKDECPLVTVLVNLSVADISALLEQKSH